jgi:signal-transduction protein with cAMP-binding, CBS, and nucleotidyltransferase domain
MVSLIARLNGIAKMSAELIQQLYNIVTDKAFKRGHFLLKAGEVCRNIYFIEKGLVVIYRRSEKGQLKVQWILSAGDFLIVTDSFKTGDRSQFTVEVLEDTQTWCTHHEKLMYTCHKWPEFFDHYTQLDGGYRNAKEKFDGLTPKEKFDELWDTRPDLFNRVKKDLLSSYVGMVPATFDSYKKVKLDKKHF